MIWNKLWHGLLAITLILAKPAAQTLTFAKAIVPPAPAAAPASALEDVSYNCAKHLASLVRGEVQPGPLFSEGRLVFTSVDANDFSPLLIVNSGSGNYVIRLGTDGLKRIRFKLAGHTFYLSYLHGGVNPARYFEYSEDKPPGEHEADDYTLVSLSRAEGLLPHVTYAIQRTVESTLNALGDGHLTREDLRVHPLTSCGKLLDSKPSLAQNLKHNLDSLDLALFGGDKTFSPSSSRMPASAGSATPVAQPQRAAALRANTTSSLDLRDSTEWRQRVQNNNSK